MRGDGGDEPADASVRFADDGPGFARVRRRGSAGGVAIDGEAVVRVRGDSRVEVDWDGAVEDLRV